MDIFEIICLIHFVIYDMVFALFIIANKDTLTKFFKNLFTKGKKKKLTEPEPVTEAPISSDPPHKRTRMRPPKRKRPPRPKIELHPLCSIKKAFGWISAKAKLVAPKAVNLFVGILEMIGKAIFLSFEIILCIISFQWFKPLCGCIAAPFNKIDVDKAFAVSEAILGTAAYATFKGHNSALSD